MKRLIAIFMTLCLVFGLSSVGTWAADATWQAETPMSKARAWLDTATVGDKIYVIGGQDNNGALSILEIYDTITKTWSTGQSLPEPRSKFTASVVGNKIYVFGGTSGVSTQIKNTMLIYDITTNTWSTGKSMTTARMNPCSVVIGTKIYVLGGNDVNNTSLNKVEIYDTVADVWTAGTDMPIAKSYFNSNSIGNKIYIMGGLPAASTINIYDTETNSWSTGTSMPTNRYSASSQVIDGNIYVVGGSRTADYTTVNTVEIYYPTSNTWGVGPSLTNPKEEHAIAYSNGKLYIIGGNLSTTYYNSVESLQIIPQVVIPNAPTSLTATGGNSVVDLSWGAVSGATSYTVKRSTTAGGPYTVIAENVTGTTYSDTNVTNGTTYYYVVTAVNSAGSSANSNEASATPQAPASAGKVLLVITMSNGLEKEYDLTMTEINAFINWYDGKAAGSGSGYYTFNKTFNLGPFLTRVDYITFDKIQNFEVMKYQ